MSSLRKRVSGKPLQELCYSKSSPLSLQRNILRGKNGDLCQSFAVLCFFIHEGIDRVVSIQARVCMTDAELSNIWPPPERSRL